MFGVFLDGVLIETFDDAEEAVMWALEELQSEDPDSFQIHPVSGDGEIDVEDLDD